MGEIEKEMETSKMLKKEKSDLMQQVKCSKCKQRLLDVRARGTIIIKCSRCGSTIRIVLYVENKVEIGLH